MNRIIFNRMILGMLLIISNISLAQKFTIPVFPDSQAEVSTQYDKTTNIYPKRFLFTMQAQWIADKKDSLNLPIVLHVGDVANYDTITHWEFISTCYDILDNANIPYAFAVGNHDTEAVGARSGGAASSLPGETHRRVRLTSKFNTTFPVSRFPIQQGRWEEGKSDNSFCTFKAGGLDWMVLSLEFCARQEPLNWAGQVIAGHPNHNVIVLTHYFMGGGAITTSNAGYGDLSPSAIFNQLKVYPNILMFLSGHTGENGYRIDAGTNGNIVYSIVSDKSGDNYGNAWLRLLDIDPAQKTISGKLYTPYTKAVSNQFNFTNVKFIQPLTSSDKLISESNGISVFPNPVKDFMQIKINDFITGKYLWSLYNQIGQVQLQGEITECESKIDIKNLAPEIYILKVNRENEIIGTYRIIKL